MLQKRQIRWICFRIPRGPKSDYGIFLFDTSRRKAGTYFKVKPLQSPKQSQGAWLQTLKPTENRGFGLYGGPWGPPGPPWGWPSGNQAHFDVFVRKKEIRFQDLDPELMRTKKLGFAARDPHGEIQAGILSKIPVPKSQIKG